MAYCSRWVYKKSRRSLVKLHLIIGGVRVVRGRWSS
uniref:Uncharacterized protein n=1 Tax=Arundo donax TaxID=35708 RepID=A0A0A9B3T4_ARUDO